MDFFLSFRALKLMQVKQKHLNFYEDKEIKILQKEER